MRTASSTSKSCDLDRQTWAKLTFPASRALLSNSSTGTCSGSPRLISAARTPSAPASYAILAAGDPGLRGKFLSVLGKCAMIRSARPGSFCWSAQTSCRPASLARVPATCGRKRSTRRCASSKPPARSAACTVSAVGSTPFISKASTASSLPKLATEFSRRRPIVLQGAEALLHSSNTGRTETLLQSSLTLVHKLSSSVSVLPRCLCCSCCSISEHSIRMRLPHAEPGMSLSTSRVAAPAASDQKALFSVSWVAACGIAFVASATHCAAPALNFRWTLQASLNSPSPTSMITSIAPL
mmetsp:Transcript_132736/g.234845  ORF Transcript_132736/g.234845 Transcript_132736/m.234845 type:complete len:297 (+) Transcript_132736:172-1062(+)